MGNITKPPAATQAFLNAVRREAVATTGKK
jgi:hypothetical protein